MGISLKVHVKKIIYVIENEGIKNFEMIRIDHLQKIVMELSKKKNAREETTSNILKAILCIIKKFVDIINNSLKEGCCSES